ncbi:endophilin-B1-like isoform X9 [Tachypleus tridentatus]|uniref:endophilin-B1-like isoform X9 n=1 Tax=Tachypleus tridentatus TaxID=6853 RepID=UPI003FD42A5A
MAWSCAMSTGIMEFSVKSFKGFANEAGKAFTRVVQYTEEKLGTSEKTEFDVHFETLAERADKTKHWTERIVARTDAILQPNPNAKVEDYLYEKLERKREKQTNFEALGQDMMDAGSEFGAGTAYGSTLIKVGQTQQKLGQAEKEFIHSVSTGFIRPLRGFLEGDMKTIQAEQELRVIQSEYDRQVEITTLLLEGISSSHANQLKYLSEFVEAQMAYFAKCQNIVSDLERQLSSMSVIISSTGTTGTFQNSYSANCLSPTSFTDDKRKRARVLYDYDALDKSELSLLANEVIYVTSELGQDPDWVIGEHGLLKGKVPLAYLEFLS